MAVVRGRCGPLRSDDELADDALRLRAFLVARGLADPARVAVAGHSRGGKDAILAAVRPLRSGEPPFAAVVAFDPDDDDGRALYVFLSSALLGATSAALEADGAVVRVKAREGR